MNKKVLISAVVGSIANFFLGWLVYGIAGMEQFMKNHSTHYEGLDRPMDGMMLGCIFLAGLASSWFYAYIFDRWAHPASFMDGFKTGAILALAIGLSYDLYFLGAMNLMSGTAIAADIIVGTIMGGVTAGIIAWMQNRSTATAV